MSLSTARFGCPEIQIAVNPPALQTDHLVTFALKSALNHFLNRCRQPQTCISNFQPSKVEPRNGRQRASGAWRRIAAQRASGRGDRLSSAAAVQEDRLSEADDPQHLPSRAVSQQALPGREHGERIFQRQGFLLFSHLGHHADNAAIRLLDLFDR